jgi:WD40 repeat protein
MVNDTSSGTKLQTLDGNAGDVFSVDFSPDGQTLVSAARDELIILWDTSTWKKVRSFSPGVYAVFSPDGRTLAGGTYGGEVILWDVSSGTRLQTLTGHSEHVLSLAFSADGKLLASGSRDGKVMIWKLDNP